MVKIRLKRMGYKRNPIFRIVVIDVRSKREGAPIQELGHYNPKRKEMKLNKEAALEWIQKGAQPTETVQYLINNCNEEGGLVVKEKAKKPSKKAQAKLDAEKAAKEAEKAEAKAAKAAPVKEEAVEVVEAPVAEAVTEEAKVEAVVEEAALAKAEVTEVVAEAEVTPEVVAEAEEAVAE
ncbi:MAG: 30S ribosomal protein S16 [bacterium]